MKGLGSPDLRGRAHACAKPANGCDLGAHWPKVLPVLKQYPDIKVEFSLDTEFHNIVRRRVLTMQDQFGAKPTVLTISPHLSISEFKLSVKAFCDWGCATKPRPASF